MKRALGLLSDRVGIAIVGILLFAPSLALAQSALPSSCPSASVQDTVNSSLQQLTEVADQISVENLPQSVLVADETLVSAISQVILQVEEACMPPPTESSSESATPPPTPVATAQIVTSPTTVVITASAVNVRSLPDASAATASAALSSGTEFTAVGEVTGESVDGNDLWYVSSSGDYIWSGGAQLVGELSSGSEMPATPLSITAVQGYNPTTGVYEATANIVESGDTYIILYGTFDSSDNTVSINGQALPTSDISYQSASQINVSIGTNYADQTITVSVSDANGASQGIAVSAATSGETGATPATSGGISTGASLPAPTTKTISSSNVSYAVTYSYLADGEVRATFTYKSKPYAVQNYNVAFQFTSIAEVQSNGSFSVPWTGQSDLTLIALANQISLNAPANVTVFPGFTFVTPLWQEATGEPGVPANVFYISQSTYSNVPQGFYDLDTNSAGSLVGVTPVTISSTGAVTEGIEIEMAGEATSSAPAVPTISASALQNEITDMDFYNAIQTATNAGYLVYVTDDGNGTTLATIEDPLTGAVVAAISQVDD